MTKFTRTLLASAVAGAAFLLPAQAEVVSYQAEPTHSYVRATYTHLGLSHQGLEFPAISGTFDIDLDDPEASVIDVTIDMLALDTNTGGEEFYTHLSSSDFFNFEEFATAHFVATELSVSEEDNTKGTMTGDLTIHGVTQPVTFDVTLNFQGDHPMMGVPALGVSASGEILRSDFGVGAYTPYVSDEVELNIQIELIVPAE